MACFTYLLPKENLHVDQSNEKQYKAFISSEIPKT